MSDEECRIMPGQTNAEFDIRHSTFVIPVFSAGDSAAGEAGDVVCEPKAH
jgi:hypothetical protein